MKKKQDNETKVYLVYDEELDQFVLKKGDDCTILEVLDLKDPGTEKLILFDMRKMKDKKKYATRFDWGEIPGLFFIEKCSHKTIDFCSYTTYNKDS